MLHDMKSQGNSEIHMGNSTKPAGFHNTKNSHCQSPGNPRAGGSEGSFSS